MIMTLFLVWISAICNGVMDEIMHHDRYADNKFFAKDAWKNKYKNGDPAQGPKFFGSTSFLSFVCDGWHLMKELMISSIVVALTIMESKLTNMPGVITYVIFRGAFYLGFRISYR